MKFPYAVKYNGVFYPANTEIKEVKPVEKTPKATSKVSDKQDTKKAVKGDK